MTSTLQKSLFAAVIAASAMASVSAHAGSATLTLVRGSLDNDTDTAGLWQYEGGKILSTSGANVGTYIVTRRVTTSGTSTYNTAAVTTSLFFPSSTAGNPPSVITLEGSHSYTTGAFLGSVSGASNRYHWVIDADAVGTVPAAGSTKLVITWDGSSQLLIP